MKALMEIFSDFPKEGVPLTSAKLLKNFSANSSGSPLSRSSSNSSTFFSGFFVGLFPEGLDGPPADLLGFSEGLSALLAPGLSSLLLSTGSLTTPVCKYLMNSLKTPWLTMGKVRKGSRKICYYQICLRHFEGN